MTRNSWILVLVVAVLFLIFVLQNTEVVAVRFLLWEARMSRALLLLLTAAFAFVCGLLLRPRLTVRR